MPDTLFVVAAAVVVGVCVSVAAVAVVVVIVLVVHVILIVLVVLAVVLHAVSAGCSGLLWGLYACFLGEGHSCVHS